MNRDETADGVFGIVITAVITAVVLVLVSVIMAVMMYQGSIYNREIAVKQHKITELKKDIEQLNPLILKINEYKNQTKKIYIEIEKLKKEKQK
jgi:Tfp pilus assembly protein PilN